VQNIGIHYQYRPKKALSVELYLKPNQTRLVVFR